MKGKDGRSDGWWFCSVRSSSWSFHVHIYSSAISGHFVFIARMVWLWLVFSLELPGLPYFLSDLNGCTVCGGYYLFYSNWAFLLIFMLPFLCQFVWQLYNFISFICYCIAYNRYKAAKYLSSLSVWLYYSFPSQT